MSQTQAVPLFVPRLAIRGGRLNVAAYIAARGAGETQLAALRAAGSKVAPGGASKIAGRLEARPGVAEAIEEARAIRAQEVKEHLAQGWASASKYLRDLVEGNIPGATNFDRLNAAQQLGRAAGAFVSKIEIESNVVGFRGFSTAPMPRPVESGPVEPALPESTGE